MHSIGRSDIAQSLSDAVHEALVGAFGIPRDDYFHVVTAHPPRSELFGPSNFLNIPHAETMVFVQIACAPGRSVEQKKNLYAQIAEGLAATGQVRRQDVIINLIESSRENWSFGEGLAQFVS
jgi:phenylpyruvate tautomerase PptA (4-oxalocrotonate tautomerase family)